MARSGSPAGHIIAHPPRQQPLRAKQQNEDHQPGIEHEAVFLDDLEFLRKDHDEGCGDRHAPEIADAAEKDDRHEDERIREGEIVGGDEAEHMAIEPRRRCRRGNCRA